jgi:hypothetical protein
MHELGIGLALRLEGLQRHQRSFVANGIVSPHRSPVAGNHCSSGDLNLNTEDHTAVYRAFKDPWFDVQAVVEGLSRLGSVTQYLRFQSLFATTTTTYTGSLYHSDTALREISISE